MIKVKIDVHSSASFDCAVEPGEVPERCLQLGLSPIFLTDHNTIGSALTLRATRAEVDVGEEVMTSNLIALGASAVTASTDGGRT